MFLKQIEILGFKSFANKTTVDFAEGVTAVVGPNGSGKSNITDAIKWVLGEQSAKSLRGSKMEDIIFSGSDGKKPLNIAEVTIILDNSDRYLPYDYSEISVTRRVYRSGESEYILNGQKCRLKDIIDLFLDSGLGREAYSIISQGKIDEILNSKAEDKRKIFEEAAGVLKYKTRKQSAEKKLAESEENLNRVEDILYELEAQKGPLEEQASIAKDYLEKKEALQSVEIALLAHDIGALHQKWEGFSKSVGELKEKAVGQAADIQKQEAVHEELETHIQAYDESINDLQEALIVASSLHEKYEGEKKVLMERERHAKENAERFRVRIEELEGKKAQEEQELEAEKGALDTQRQDLHHLLQTLDRKNDQLKHFERDLEDELETLKSRYYELMNQGASIQNEIRFLEEQTGQISEKRSRIEREEEEVAREYQRAESLKNDLTQKLNEKRSECQGLAKQIEQLEKNLVAAQSELEKRREAQQKIERLIQQSLSRREMLKEMEEDYAGFYGGAKMVLKAKNKHVTGVHGAVAELIKVNKSYEVAIETALGGAMQHIVVDTETSAREAIRFLKTRKAGRATFLPLSVIQPRRVPEQDIRNVKDHEAFVGTAAALVSCDAIYHKVVGQLLGNIIISKDLKGAGEMAKRLGYRYRIVTLDGDVVSPGGAMSGGSRKSSTVNLLGRSREIEQLDQQLREMTDKQKALQEQIQQQSQSLNEKRRRMAAIRNEYTINEKELRTIEDQLKEILYTIKHISERRDLLGRDRSGLTDEQAAAVGRLQKLKDEQSDMAKQEIAIKKEIESASDKKENQQAAKASLQSEITDLKIAIARKQEMVTAQTDKTERRSQQLEAIAKELQEARNAVQSLDQSLNGQSLDHHELNKNIENCLQDKERITSWIAERRRQRLDLSEELKSGVQELKELKRLYKGTEEALRREEIALERCDAELDNLLDTLRETYQLGYETAQQRYPLSVEPAEARKQVKLIKRSIEELGTVNLGAIDEYERVSTRYQFLNEQRDDLLQAKDTLLSVISEMDEEVRKRFQETFDQVRDHFQDIFRQLFGGGRADLELTDPDDLLYSGIEIVAQPPGKKLQNLSLLSGGERALTAIVLLFAILKVRPVPFCVLDEVEAALDDANVDRYADFLKAFSRDTQFIVVTHRKGTMEQADALYGVTMQVSGVSRLVSVRLDDVKEMVS
ncbi:chromosome segregation protein SMC [Camelliibacillus cellulosilyticus]|uniref:Chromosome partition protein Smc n=1 Tax=Camelliibacillus cellulosilyticus TaxID=2174486 RepID=A0ABV9GKW6_9BACL